MHTGSKTPILFTAAYTSAKLCANFYDAILFISLMTVKQRAFSCPPGIRSFGSGDDQKAVIQFGTPLTLISGQNGAGKTVWEINLILCSHSPTSVSPALPLLPSFRAPMCSEVPHPACHWQKTGWGPADKAIQVSCLCRFRFVSCQWYWHIYQGQLP